MNIISANVQPSLPRDNRIDLGSLNTVFPKVVWELIFDYLNNIDQYVLNRLSIFFFNRISLYTDTKNIVIDAAKEGLLEHVKYLIIHCAKNYELVDVFTTAVKTWTSRYREIFRQIS